jgi:hypothetical protein
MPTDEENAMQVSMFALAQLALLLMTPAVLFSQQMTIGTPFGSINDGYYESYGVSWNVGWCGGFARFGMPGQPIPPFGRFDPSAGFQTGWRFGNGNFHGSFCFSAAQGSYRSFTSQTPFVTVLNGYPGAFYDLSVSPFVAGYVPVVGGYPVLGPALPGVAPQDNTGDPNPLDRVQVMRRLLAEQNRGTPAEAGEPDPGRAMLPRRADDAPAESHPMGRTAESSAAARPAPSLAEAKRLHEREEKSADDDVAAIFEKAKAAEENHQPQVAKIYYQMVVRRAHGDLEEAAQRRLKELPFERR